jgi:nucleotide-binding universal stress UspA family protein
VILIAYDGSADARAAIDHAGQVMGAEPATVLTVWEPVLDLMARVGAGMAMADVDFGEVDRSSEEQARRQADEGAERARNAGLDANPRVRTRRTSIAETILAEADDLGARAIVVGTRGLTGIKSLLLGSVSHALLQHADRPVTVVPSPEVAAARAAHRR